MRSGCTKGVTPMRTKLKLVVFFSLILCFACRVQPGARENLHADLSMKVIDAGRPRLFLQQYELDRLQERINGSHQDKWLKLKAAVDAALDEAPPERSVLSVLLPPVICSPLPKLGHNEKVARQGMAGRGCKIKDPKGCRILGIYFELGVGLIVPSLWVPLGPALGIVYPSLVFDSFIAIGKVLVHPHILALGILALSARIAQHE